MNKQASIEMHKIVIWAISIMVLLAILMFMIGQLSPGTGGSLANQTIDGILNIQP